jgi:ketosteroid isomerase-like protein
VEDRTEIARRLLDAFNDRDIEAICAVTTPDVRFTVIAEQVTGELPDGHDGLREWFGVASRTWERLEAGPGGVELEERGDWLLGTGITRATARGTEKGMVWLWTAAIKVEGDLISRFGIYLSREEALRAISENEGL